MKFIGDVLNLITWLYLKMVSSPCITYDAIDRLLLSRIITSLSFNCILYVRVKISWGSYIPPLNHVRIKSSNLKSNYIDFSWLFFVNNFHLKITWSCRFFLVKFFLLFSHWLLWVVNKSYFYLLRERPKAYDKFYVFVLNNNFQKQSLKTYLQIYFFFIIPSTCHF